MKAEITALCVLATKVDFSVGSAMVTSPQLCDFAHLVDMSSLVDMSFEGCTNPDKSEVSCANGKPGVEVSWSWSDCFAGGAKV